MENQSYLKKDLTKFLIVAVGIVLVMLILYFLDAKTNFIFQLGGKLMKIFVKS
jgi:hypothetical protein